MDFTNFICETANEKNFELNKEHGGKVGLGLRDPGPRSKFKNIMFYMKNWEIFLRKQFFTNNFPRIFLCPYGPLNKVMCF